MLAALLRSVQSLWYGAHKHTQNYMDTGVEVSGLFFWRGSPTNFCFLKANLPFYHTNSREGDLQSARSLAKHANKWGGGGSKGNPVWRHAAAPHAATPPRLQDTINTASMDKYFPGTPQPLTPIESAKIPQALAPMKRFNRSRFMCKARRDLRLGRYCRVSTS